MQKIADDVLGILKTMDFEDKKAVITQKLDPKTYKKVDVVLQALGGKWNRGKMGHLFPGDAKAIIMKALSNGDYHDAKKDDAFFATPDDLANQIVWLAEVKKGMTVLEPSAGQGAIVRALCRVEADVSCVELNPAYEKALREAGATEVVIGDFFATPVGGLFDAVVMNPPFSINNKTTDIAHVLRAWEWLKPGGTLVAITSLGWTFRPFKADHAFREFVDKFGSYTENPEGTFKEAGTNIKTLTLVLEKPSSSDTVAF